MNDEIYIGKRYLVSTTGSYRYYAAETNQLTIDTIQSEAAEIAALPFDKVKVDKLEQFKKTYNIDVKHIVAMGESNAPVNILRDVLQYDKLYGYNCYAIPNPTGLVKLHEDVRSSWNCLMAVMGAPKLLIMFKEDAL